MKKQTVLLLCLFMGGVAFSQVKTIHAQLLDRDRIPLSHFDLKVINRNIHVKTDKQGFFVLKNVTDKDFLTAFFNSNWEDVNVGSLVKGDTVEVDTYYSDDEVYIVVNDIQTLEPAMEVPVALNNEHDGLGVCYLTESTPRLLNAVASIEDFEVGGFNKVKDGYNVNFNLGRDKKIPTFGYSSYISMSNVGHLPESQSIYSPRSFFKNGVTFGTNLQVNMDLFLRSTLSIDLGQRKQETPIPQVEQKSYNMSFVLKKISWHDYISEVGLYYKRANENLGIQGSNMSRLMQNVFTDQPVFNLDNTYNPSFLVNNMLDAKNGNDVMYYAKTSKWFYNQWYANANVSYQKQWNKQTGGLDHSLSSNRYSYRNDTNSNFLFSTQLLYQHNHNSPNWKASVKYSVARVGNLLNRGDSVYQGGIYNVNTLNPTHRKRTTQDVLYYFNMDFNYVNFTISNTHYFSNTLAMNEYKNFFPQISATWFLSRFIDNMFDFSPEMIKLYVSSGRSIGEAPLVFLNKSALSTAINSSKFSSYYEYADIFDHSGVLPEIYYKNDVGFEAALNRYRTFNVSGSYFDNRTQNFIAPVNTSTSTVPVFELNNLGEVRTSGFNFATEYQGHLMRNVRCAMTLKFNRSRSSVVSLNDVNHRKYIPLAGFSNVATVFAPGEALGSIYKIDSGGLGTLLGNPTPDFNLYFTPSFSWRNLTLNMAFEYSHGGDRWNGTQAYIDLMRGMKNTSQVENYIEDASFFRFSNITLKYTFVPVKYRSHFFRKIEILAAMDNVLLKTKYKGVDPASSLYNYASSKGLDLFNMPSIHNYTLTASFNF